MVRKPIMICSGGLDPIHSGHISMIREAASLGEVVVLLNSDDWLVRKKGRYFMGWAERAAVVSAIRGVKRVLPFDDSDGTAVDGIRKLRHAHPRRRLVYCNGGDRTDQNVPEVAFCRASQIEMLWNVGGGKTQSSSTMLERWRLEERCERPWGEWTVLASYDGAKLKELIVQPGSSLSLQRHQFRSELWFCTRGAGQVQLGDLLVDFSRHQHLLVERGRWHRLINNGTEEMHVLEVQFGPRCTEDDIERK